MNEASTYTTLNREGIERTVFHPSQVSTLTRSLATLFGFFEKDDQALFVLTKRNNTKTAIINYWRNKLQ
jgi:hypothetical protein